MPRFVVLLHETPAGYSRRTHFDVMLEHQGTLRTWAVPRLPDQSQPAEGERLGDHRLGYLEFEGEIAGGRGCVRRVDAGDYDLVLDGDSLVMAELRGSLLRGTLRIEQTAEDPQRWRISLVGIETGPSV